MEKTERDPPLEQAWKRFAQYDHNAVRQQNKFNKLLLWLLALGVLGTLLAVTRTQLELVVRDRPQLRWAWELNWLISVLHYPVLISPIAVSVLLAAANRLKPGKKWVLLRGSAEAIKREIYSYRTRAGTYRAARLGQATREALLARRVEEISQRLMQTEVNMTALRPYPGKIPPPAPSRGAVEGDDGFSPLTPEQYVSSRVEDQLDYFQNKVIGLERRLHQAQWAIYIAGGLGALLAALGQDLWVALTVTVTGILGSYIGMHNIEDTLVVYNQAATDLQNVRDWWTALPAEERAAAENVDKLVSYSEKILEGELAGWVQHMQDALAELRDPQKGVPQRVDPTP